MTQTVQGFGEPAWFCGSRYPRVVFLLPFQNHLKVAARLRDHGLRKLRNSFWLEAEIRRIFVHCNRDDERRCEGCEARFSLTRGSQESGHMIWKDVGWDIDE